MVLELIIIGGVVYYYVKKNKENKLKKAAFLAGEPFHHRNGSVTYPPGYPGLPAYAPRETEYADEKRQVPVSIPVQDGDYYAPPPRERDLSSDEKAPLMVETREVMGEKKW